MAIHLSATLHGWYLNRDEQKKFQVVDIDKGAGDIISIQYLDGTIDNISETEWSKLNLETIEAPGRMGTPKKAPHGIDLEKEAAELARTDSKSA